MRWDAPINKICKPNSKTFLAWTISFVNPWDSWRWCKRRLTDWASSMLKVIVEPRRAQCRYSKSKCTIRYVSRATLAETTWHHEVSKPKWWTTWLVCRESSLEWASYAPNSWKVFTIPHKPGRTTSAPTTTTMTPLNPPTLNSTRWCPPKTIRATPWSWRSATASSGTHRPSSSKSYQKEPQLANCLAQSRLC